MLAAAAQEKGCGGIEMHQQAQALALGLGPEEGDQIGELGMEIEVDDVDRHLARLDLGEIEDLVDEGEQRAARARDRARHVALLLVEAGILEQVAHADDGVERRAQLMAHDGEEAALGPVRLLGLGLRLGQLADQRGDIGRQHDQAGQQAIGQVGLGPPERA